MESNALIVKLLHGKDVRAFNFFQKLNVYARASLVSDDPSKKLDQSQSQQQQQQQRTPTVRECDGDPEWKHEMRFDLSGIPLGDCAHVLLSVDLFHEGVMFGDKHIGEVRVPLADLAEQGDGVVRFVSYQVKNPEGKPNGVLTFSYSVHGKGAAGDSAAAAAGTAPGPIIGGYPVVNPPPPHGGWVEAGAAGSENQPSSPEIKYPMIDFQSEPGEAYPVAVPYESYYPPPESYYPHPPEMLHPLPPPPPPPPPPFAHGPCHYPPGPPPFRPWRHGPHGFGGGWRGAPWERDRGLSYWNGR